MQNQKSSATWRIKNQAKNGFTLVEMLVAIGILLILLAITLFAIDPFAQFKKVRDSQRKHDFIQIRNALDTYYNDHSCYPISIPFGEKWLDGNSILMQKVPMDPGIQCISGLCYEYYYQADKNACPQWAILYTKLEITPLLTEACVTKVIRSMCPTSDGTTCNSPADCGDSWTSCRNNLCTRPNVTTNPKYNYCLPAGQINCKGLLEANVPSGYSTSTTSSTTASTTTTTVASSQTCPGGYYACTGTDSNGCNYLDDNEAQSICQEFDGAMRCYCNSACKVDDVVMCN